jgi:hypothetical protein
MGPQGERAGRDRHAEEHRPGVFGPTLLEGDVLYRARRLIEGGADRLFADLDRNIRWTDETLSVRHRHFSGVRALDGRGLLLVPSAFIWPSVFSVTTGPWQPTLRYPPRGIATLWETEVTTPYLPD